MEVLRVCTLYLVVVDRYSLLLIFIIFIDISQLTIQEEGYAVHEGLQQSLEDKDDEGSD